MREGSGTLPEALSSPLPRRAGLVAIPNISIDGCQIVDGGGTAAWSGLRSNIELAVARAALMLPRSSS
jgi:hypothetical protein